MLFSQEPPLKAALLSALIIGGIFIPVTIRTVLGVRRGKYTNIDVSDQKQRQQWFMTITALLLAVTAIIWITKQQYSLRLAVTLASVLLISALYINKVIKSSMHMTFHAFVSLLILHFNLVAGIVFLVLLPVLGWSRLYLKRHFLNEVLVGTCMGSLFGGLFWLLI